MASQSPVRAPYSGVAARLATVAVVAVAACAAATTLALAAPADTARAADRPAFQLPFPCGQTWDGATYDGHNDHDSVDFNRAGDLRDLVVASAPGTVTIAKPSDSAGNYVAIDHGGGWTTRYLHLDRYSVAVGDVLEQGDPVGALGNTGQSQGAHLHFEEQLNGEIVPAQFDGAGFGYPRQTLTSKNSCDGPQPYTVWESPVDVRGDSDACRTSPSRATCTPVLGQLQFGDAISPTCQKEGELVGENTWWVFGATSTGVTGWLPSWHLKYPDPVLPNVPNCDDAA